MDYNFVNKPKLEINTITGLCTLPVKEVSEIKVNKVSISGTSNGIPGNSELTTVSTDNRLPKFMFDKNLNTYFEYEKYNTGPLKLDLVINFANKEIINSFSIESVALGDLDGFEISDIVFAVDDYTDVSIKELISPSLEEDFFRVKSLGPFSLWETRFVPIMAGSATLKLTQSNSYEVKKLRNDNSIATNKRFAIAIKQINFKREEYDTSGSVNSRLSTIPMGIHIGRPYVNVYPRNYNLYNLNLSATNNSGNTWSRPLLRKSGDHKDFLLNGEEAQVSWKLTVSRNDEVFKTSMSFSNEEPRTEISSMTTPVSRLNSPNSFLLREKPFNKAVTVVQPKLARRSSVAREALLLGNLGNDDKITLDLPFSLLKKGIAADDLRVFVMGQEWVRVHSSIAMRDGGPLQWGTFCFTEDYSGIMFANEEDRLGERNSVKFLLKEEKPVFSIRADGLYCKLSNLFDPDKQRIKVKNLAKSDVSKKVILSQGLKTIYLSAKQLHKFSISFEELGITHSEFSTVEEVNDAAIGQDLDYKWHIDKRNGILYLSKGLSSPVPASMMFSKEQVLDKENYEIWHEDSKPVGLIISPEIASSRDVQDIIYDPDVDLNNLSSRKNLAPVPIISSSSGYLEPRLGYKYDDNGNPTNVVDPLENSFTSFTLSHDRIVAGSLKLSPEVFGNISGAAPLEVPYIDGKTEFLNLEVMLEEYVPSMQADENGLITFKLAAGESFYNPYSVKFNDKNGESPLFYTLGDQYKTVKELIDSTANGVLPDNKGNWVADPDGTLCAYIGIGNSISSSIKVQYYYTTNLVDDKNKYSVDYKSGILYLSNKINSDFYKNHSVFYKVSEYSVSYDLVEELEDYSFNSETNSVLVNTEHMPSKINNTIKIFWGKADVDIKMGSLVKYFSPLIYNIGARFY